jgi:hypothetical protein
MKRIAILLLAALLLAACQPTPQTEIVVNKADGRLEDIIAATAEPQSETVAIAPETNRTPESESPAPVEAKPSAPLAPRMRTVDWSDSFSVAAAMDRLDVTIDASVEIPESETAPVYRIGFAPPYADEATRLLRVFFGERQAYCASHEKTKSYYKAQMARYLAEQEKTSETYEREQYDLLLNQANKVYANAPDDPPLVPWDGAAGAFDLMAENGDGTFRYLKASERSIYYLNAPEDPNILSPVVKKPVPENDAEQAAVETAQAVLDALTIDATLMSVNPTESAVRAFGTYTVDGFIVSYAPNYGGLPATDLYRYHGSDSAAEAAGGGSSADYSIRYEPESIEFLISKSGELVRFKYMRPSRVLNTENEAAKLLPFEDVQALFKSDIGKVMFVDKGYPMQLTVHTVRLTMQRYPIKDNETELYLLPAWEFVASVNDGTAFADRHKTVCVLRINALDGSIMR